MEQQIRDVTTYICALLSSEKRSSLCVSVLVTMGDILPLLLG